MAGVGEPETLIGEGLDGLPYPRFVDDFAGRVFGAGGRFKAGHARSSRGRLAN